MKNGIKLLAIACVALLFAGCHKSTRSGTEPEYDAWMLSTWSGGGELAGKVFLQLRDDGSFVLYQSIDNPGFARLTGTYVTTPGAELTPPQASDGLSGVYADGTPWEDTYLSAFSNGGKTMTLISLVGGVESVYVRTVLPDYVSAVSQGVRTSVPETPFL